VSPGRPAVAGRDIFFVGIFFAALLAAVPAISEESITVSATAPGKLIALGSKPVIASLLYRPTPRAAHLAHCYVLVSGLTASRPVGQYEIKVVARGMDVAPDDFARAGTISFYDAVGIPPAKTAPLSFEVPVHYCRHDAYVTLTPAGGANPAGAASIGSISLIAR
jgi:hypothetical protein